MDVLEGTAEFNRGHARATGEIPITVVDGADGLTPDMLRGRRGSPAAVVGAAQHEVDTLDDFASAMEVIDDDPIVASCDLENPESCESCQ